MESFEKRQRERRKREKQQDKKVKRKERAEAKLLREPGAETAYPTALESSYLGKDDAPIAPRRDKPLA